MNSRAHIAERNGRIASSTPPGNPQAPEQRLPRGQPFPTPVTKQPEIVVEYYFYRDFIFCHILNTLRTPPPNRVGFASRWTSADLGPK